jgi:hypothetical protein
MGSWCGSAVEHRGRHERTFDERVVEIGSLKGWQELTPLGLAELSPWLVRTSKEHALPCYEIWFGRGNRYPKSWMVRL